jgi:hypothetical protein
LALNPTNPDILIEISRTYAAEGQYGKAIQYAEQAVSLDPSNPRLHGNLGVMLYQNDEYSLAADELSLVVHGGTTADGMVVEDCRCRRGGLPTTTTRYTRYHSPSLTNVPRPYPSCRPS